MATTKTEAERTFEEAVRAAVRAGVVDPVGIAQEAAKDERRIRSDETARKVYGR